MFNNQPNPDADRLHDLIEVLALNMNNHRPDSDEYAKMVDQLIKLQTLKTDTGPKRISPDARATILANLAGIVVIVGHERAHLITSKALGFVRKLV